MSPPNSPSSLTTDSLLPRAASGPLSRHLETIRAAASGWSDSVYLVGGAVRDLLLGRPSRDIDLVVIGEEGELAARLADALRDTADGEPPPVESNKTFMTAKFRTGDGFTVDVARARAESYDGPAALPSVRPGSLEDDLRRRDFTVNAMALPLNRMAAADSTPVAFGSGECPLIDPYGGISDLEAGLLRVLHDQSFVDDPTRVLRGLRLAADLEVAFEASTDRLARHDDCREALAVTSGFRIWRELKLCFRSVAGARTCIAHLADSGLAEAIHPALAGLADLAEAAGDASGTGAAEPGEIAEMGCVSEVTKASDGADVETVARQASAAPSSASNLSTAGRVALEARILAEWAQGLKAEARWSLAERLALTRAERRALGAVSPRRRRGSDRS